MMEFGHDIRKRHLLECVRQMARWRLGLENMDDASDNLVSEVMQGVHWVNRGLLKGVENIETATTDQWIELRDRCKLESFPMMQNFRKSTP